MKKLVIIVLAIVFALLAPINVNAAGVVENCKPIYGGGESCLPQDKISVDKKVKVPNSDKFVDNLTQAQAKYKAGDTIAFQLTITNKGKETLKEVTAIDKLPAYIIYTSGPGNFDAKTRTLSFRFNNLKPNESRNFMIVGTVNNVGKSTCVVNYASVRSGNLKADDNSRFCLEKSVCVEGPASQTQPNQPNTKGGFPVMPAPKGMTQTPATGPSALALLSLLPLGLAGFYIRKKV
ncbi:MAG: DUF11 domain-containing protein [Candidatus Levybacteria bacterium]|nr:DUF11 domain-containing protein [Candidatus Levybacteria bacterium]